MRAKVPIHECKITKVQAMVRLRQIKENVKCTLLNYKGSTSKKVTSYKVAKAQPKDTRMQKKIWFIHPPAK